MFTQTQVFERQPMVRVEDAGGNLIVGGSYQVTVSVLDTNNINDQINVKISIDHSATYTTYVSHEIYLEFNKNSKGFLECNYNIPSY